MAELEDFKLIFSRLILLFNDGCVTVIVYILRLWSTHHHWVLWLIASHEGLIVLKSRLLHIVQGLHCHVLNLVRYIIDRRIYATQGL